MSSPPTEEAAEEFKRPPLRCSVNFRCTSEEKKALDRISWENDRSNSQTVRRALKQVMPEIFAPGHNGNGGGS